MLWKIIRDGTNETAAFAAGELKRYLSQIDPLQEIAILAAENMTETVTDGLYLTVRPEILEGEKDPFYDDAVDILVENGAGHIYGSNPRSVLMGVYRFLQALGCSFLRPGKDGEVIPKKDLNGCKVMEKQTPSYRHRGVTIEGAVSYDHVMDMIDWMPKMGMNAYFNQFLDVPFTFYDRWYSHTDNETMEPKPLSRDEVRAIRDISVQEIKKRGMMYHAAGHGWTCEPFGLTGDSWDEQEIVLTDEQRECVALVNGKREVWQGIPLNSNLCYSNPRVRQIMVQAVVDYLVEHPQVDLLHLWLADGSNNACECDACRKKMPSEWYLTLLNEIDAALTEKKMPQKIVFLIYSDLLWAPQSGKLVNPDRFVMMFAPIFRTYSVSVTDAEPFEDQKLPAYARNDLHFPASVSENLAWLYRWQKIIRCDGFDFDYHYMWDHFLDPGYEQMAQILLKDVKGLHQIGLNGLLSCQLQRTWFPTGLGMHLMAAGLWDDKLDFEEASDAYYEKAFGPDGQIARTYLKKISAAFDPRFMRRETDNTPEEDCARLQKVAAITAENKEAFSCHAADPLLPAAVRQSWHLLKEHTRYCELLSEALIAELQGDGDAAFETFYDWVKAKEPELHPGQDVYELLRTFRRRQEHLGSV